MVSTTPHSKHFLDGKKIVIAGAGVSGLAFTISIHKLWPQYSTSPVPQITLFERDPSAVPPGREGYSLSLRSDPPSAGIQTLQKMGILEDLLNVSIARLGGEEEAKGDQGGFVVWDGRTENWKPVMKIRSKTPPGCPVAGMRIHRAALRRTLVEAVERLPGVEIRWGEAITSISPSPSPSSQVTIHTTSGVATETADLLIAADGSSSPLRALLRPSDTLTFAGPTAIFGTSPLSSSPGSPVEYGTVISGQGPALFCAPTDDNRMIWALSWPVSSPPAIRKPPLDQRDMEEILDKAKGVGGEALGKRFLGILMESEREGLRGFNAMDKGGFAHTGGYVEQKEMKGLEGKVLFVGDANHAVSPFAGNGANLAIADGWDLADSLMVRWFKDGLRKAVERYDRLAVGRARMVVKTSRWNIGIMHSGGWRLVVALWVLRVVQWLFF
ncbi:FAD/NAD(P)-binding domain-containing protein [Amniculicola lignicola CBS 123094]|uniref:FAD/NAD(P)-binding domain-containing protein n=1 Tax=Amniculicola lignicola CBS 123094 TaxID=1392246 RepID=A0A6A5X2L1_9PLEO|nr:FAD/NAD(P)-binding domain-containing protein [Amniculicola lignicola CBS 123094]